MVGGVERYIDSVLTALAARGIEVALWTEGDDPANRAAIRSPEGSPSWCVAELGESAAFDALRDWKPDLIYGHGFQQPSHTPRTLQYAPGVYFAHAYHGICVSGAKTFTRPQIEACHRPFGLGCLANYYPRRCGGRNPFTALSLYRQQAIRLRTLRLYARRLTHSRYVAEEYRRNGVPTDVIAYVFEPAIDAESAAQTNDRLRLPLADDRLLRRLVFVGRMDRLKGGSVLLDAIPIIAKKLNLPIQLTMVGDGPERLGWEKRSLEIGRKNPACRIEFAGWRDKTDVARLVGESDVAVVPSLWPEPFGMVGPEANSSGVPVAAFDVGGVREWLQDGVNGHLAPGNPPTASGLADAVVRCLEDPTHFRRLRDNARAAAARFSMAVHLDELLRVFKDVSGDVAVGK